MAVEGAILPPIFNNNGSPARFRQNSLTNLNSSPSTSGVSSQLPVNRSNSAAEGSNGGSNAQQFQQTTNATTSSPQTGAAPGTTGNQVNMVAYLPRPAYRFKPQITVNATDVEGYGRRLRRNMAQVRRHIDCVASVLNYLEAHDSAVRAMKWSRNDLWMVTADHDGFVKYWQANMNNVTMFQAHKEAVRSLSFCPGDTKFATASDDGTVRVWDFMRCHEERIFRGHGSDVRCVDWHPTKALLVSGSRDSQQPVKMWDAKSGQCLATLHDHKNAVMAVQWNTNGNWMLSASRDHLIKLYDIRMMKEVATFRGHKKEVTAISWHPIHEGLFVSGGADGAMMFWLAGNEREVGLMETAHEQAVWCLKWHPLGHILASGSNDNNTKFWARNKPGDLLEDFYGMVGNNPYEQHAVSVAGQTATVRPPQNMAVADDSSDTTRRDGGGQAHNAQQHQGPQGNWERRDGPLPIPGMGLGDDVVTNLKDDSSAVGGGIPGLGVGLPGLGGVEGEGNLSGRKTLLKQPPPKKEQRQFERVWNVSNHGFIPEYEEAPVVMDPDYRKIKPSLLGAAPPGMGGGGMMDMPMNPPNLPPGGPNREPMHGGPPPMSNWSSPPMEPMMSGPPPPFMSGPPPNLQMNNPPGNMRHQGPPPSLMGGPPPPHFFGGGGDGGGDNQWINEPLTDHHGDVDFRHQMGGPWGGQQSGQSIPLDLGFNEGYDNYYNPSSQQSSAQQLNPRDPRTQRGARNAPPSDMTSGYSNMPPTPEYGDTSQTFNSRDPRTGAGRYQGTGPARLVRHDSKDEFSMDDGSEGGGRQPPNPKRKWKQDYEAEEAQEKRWQGDDDDDTPPSGDVDERRMMTRGRPRRRYN